MLAFIKGKIEEKSLKDVVIDTGNLGFRAMIPLSTYERLPDLGSEVKLYTYYQVREDSHTIFGFSTQQERDFFLLLLNISGIGAKSALNALSHLDPASLKRAIINNDVKKIASIPGLGKKSAERITMELKEKVRELPIREREPWKKMENEEVQDAIDGLIALGYKSFQAKEAVISACEGGAGNASAEDLIKKALRFLRVG